jgi:hypothetical protein
MHDKLPLRKALLKNKLLTFVLTLTAFPNLIITLSIVYSFFNFREKGTWIHKPKLYYAGFGFMTYFIIYVIFRFVSKNKIHLSVITAISVNLIIFMPLLIDDYRSPHFNLTVAIDIWSIFLFQLFFFGAFTITISLLDRHTAIREWKRLLIAFALAAPVGALASWIVLAQMERLFYILNPQSPRYIDIPI